MMNHVQPTPRRPTPWPRLGRRRPGRATPATGLLGLLLALLGTGVALFLTTAAPPPTSLPGVLEVAVHPTTVPAGSTVGRPGATPARTPPARTSPAGTATTRPKRTATVPATTPATTRPASTAPATTAPATTVPARTVPATTVPRATLPPAPSTPSTTVTGHKPSGDHRSSGDGSTTVVAPSPSVQVEDSAGHQVGGDH